MILDAVRCLILGPLKGCSVTSTYVDRDSEIKFDFLELESVCYSSLTRLNGLILFDAKRHDILSLRGIKDIEGYILKEYVNNPRFTKLNKYDDIVENVESAINSFENNVNIDLSLSRFVTVNPDVSLNYAKKYIPFLKFMPVPYNIKYIEKYSSIIKQYRYVIVYSNIMHIRRRIY